MLLTENVVQCESLAKVPWTQVHALLTRDSFACVRGLIAPAEVAHAKEIWRSQFDASRDHVIEPGSRTELRRNIQYVVDRPIGNSAGARAQLLRAFYNPLWDDDLFGMRDVFRRVATCHNLLMGLPAHFAMEKPERGLWTASRIHQYPRGGGFMVLHRDNTFSSFFETLGIPAYYQVTLVMSRKGVDYAQGGAYFMRDGDRVFFEDECELGDLMIYDDRIPHGVDAIDPAEPLDLCSPLGRLAGFANLFRLL